MRAVPWLVASVVLVGAAYVWIEQGQTAANDKANKSGTERQVTFNRDIAPILFQSCAKCHHPGEVAPFSLLTYRDTQRRAEQIREVTQDRYMPPWKSVKGHGSFVDERRLTAAQIELIGQWVEQGAVEGDAADLPPTPKFENGWKLGPPDIVITMPEEYSIPAAGPDIYRNFALPLEIPEGKFIKAVEYRPGNRRVVHHAAMSMDATGIAHKKDEEDPEPGYPGSLVLPGQLFPGSLAAWTPGRDPLPLPEGLSLPWKSGAYLLLQLHLHPSGKPETEQSSVGFYLTDEAPQRSMIDLLLIDPKIDIPAGESAYHTRDEVSIPIDMEAFGIFPHMHLIGRELKVTAFPPGDAEPIPLLWITDWDFNWQNFYQYKEPLRLPAGTRLVLEAVHDNSAENFSNPNHPPKRVTWGEQTTNEMSIAVLQLVPVKEEERGELQSINRRRLLGGIAAEGSGPEAVIGGNRPNPAELLQQLLAQFDANNDGKMSYEELSKASNKPVEEIEKFATPFDFDKDRALNIAELAVAYAKLRNKKPQ